MVFSKSKRAKLRAKAGTGRPCFSFHMRADQTHIILLNDYELLIVHKFLRASQSLWMEDYRENHFYGDRAEHMKHLNKLYSLIRSIEDSTGFEEAQQRMNL